MDLAEYHQAIAGWVKSQRILLGSKEEPVAHDTLSAQIGYQTGARISGESLRGWEQLKLKKRISGEKEEAIAAYCQATGQDHPAWLPRRGVTQSTATNPIDYITQAMPHQAAEVADIAAAAIRWLVHHGYSNERPYPLTQGEVIDAMIQRADHLIRDLTMPADRWGLIVAGDRPTMGEAAMISRLFTPPGDVDRVMALYLPPKPDPQKSGSQTVGRASKMKG
jgi:hypothetical protein